MEIMRQQGGFFIFSTCTRTGVCLCVILMALVGIRCILFPSRQPSVFFCSVQLSVFLEKKESVAFSDC